MRGISGGSWTGGSSECDDAESAPAVLVAADENGVMANSVLRLDQHRELGAEVDARRPWRRRRLRLKPGACRVSSPRTISPATICLGIWAVPIRCGNNRLYQQRSIHLYLGRCRVLPSLPSDSSWPPLSGKRGRPVRRLREAPNQPHWMIQLLPCEALTCRRHSRVARRAAPRSRLRLPR